MVSKKQKDAELARLRARYTELLSVIEQHSGCTGPEEDCSLGSDIKDLVRAWEYIDEKMGVDAPNS